MEASLRPHRGGYVLALGILGLVPLVGAFPFGIPAWVMGSKDLRGMDLNQVDASGRKLTQAGRVCGIVGTVLWLMLCPPWLLMYGGTAVAEHFVKSADRRRYETAISSLRYPTGQRESEFVEAPNAAGEMVKDGPFILWARDGKKLAQGIYDLGRRTGTWTFWNDDGSVDHAQSGVYENDVKVRD